jgi:hypothetical protein
MVAVAAIDHQMLQRVWQELDYRIDICHDMLPFGVTIPAAVPQKLEIPEGLTNYPIHFIECAVCGWCHASMNSVAMTLADGCSCSDYLKNFCAE